LAELARACHQGQFNLVELSKLMGLGKLFSALFVLNSQQKSETVNMTVRFAPDSSFAQVRPGSLSFCKLGNAL